MNLNPYEPSPLDTSVRGQQRWLVRVHCFITRRCSPTFILASLAGLLLGVAWRAGLVTAIGDVATLRGLSFFTLFSLIAAIASLLYRPESCPRRVALARVVGGVSFGCAFMLLEPYVNLIMRTHPDYDIRNTGFYFFGILGSSVAIGVVTQALLTSRGYRQSHFPTDQTGG